jgi:hypothetical protein
MCGGNEFLSRFVLVLLYFLIVKPVIYSQRNLAYSQEYTIAISDTFSREQDDRAIASVDKLFNQLAFASL